MNTVFKEIIDKAIQDEKLTHEQAEGLAEFMETLSSEESDHESSLATKTPVEWFREFAKSLSSPEGSFLQSEALQHKK